MKVEESKLEGSILYIKYSDKLTDGSTTYLEVNVDIGRDVCFNEEIDYIKDVCGNTLKKIVGDVTFSLQNGIYKIYNIKPVKKLTIEDIEKKLGYKVEIVSK